MKLPSKKRLIAMLQRVEEDPEWEFVEEEVVHQYHVTEGTSKIGAVAQFYFQHRETGARVILRAKDGFIKLPASWFVVEEV